MTPLEETAALVAAGAAFIAAITSAVALVMGFRNRSALHEMRVTINGQLGQLIALATRTGHAEGKAEEQAEEAERKVEAGE